MPSASPDTIHQLIEREFDALSPELQRAARWVRQHRAALALRSMRASARDAGVSPATMTRLAQRLGFDGFEALRAPYIEQLAADTPMPDLARARAQQKHAAERQTLQRLNALQQANVAAVVALNPPRAIDAAADELLRARRVFFLGLRACYGVAFHLHYAWGMLKANGHLADDRGGTLADQATRLTRGDTLVAISLAPYTRQTVEVTAAARAAGARVVALTDALLAPIARDAQHVLLFESASPFFMHSKTGAQALAESLIAAVAARGGAPVLARLRRMQQHLRASRAYWERTRERTRPESSE